MIPPHEPGKVSQYDNFILAGIGSAIKHMDAQGIEYDRGFYLRMMEEILGRYDNERNESNRR